MPPSLGNLYKEKGSEPRLKYVLSKKVANQVEAQQDSGDQEACHADEQAPNAARVVQPGVVGAQDADEVDEVKSLKNLVNR